MHRLLLIASLILHTLVNSYVITVRSKSQIYCVNEDPTSAVFVLPPRGKRNSRQNSLNDACSQDWKNEWILENSTTLPLGPISDKRWEDLPLSNTELKSTTEFNSSFYFSVYSTSDWELRLTNNDDPVMLDYRSSDINKWNHYSVVLKGNSTFIYKNNDLVNSGPEFTPTQFTIQSKDAVLWRPHEYTFWWSNLTSQQPSTLEIDPKGKTCLLLHTSQCAECFLNVYVNSKMYRIVRKLPEETNVQVWQTDKIDIDPTEMVNVTFLKRVFHSKLNGFWAIDIQLCTNHTEFFDDDAKSENPICYELNNDSQSSLNLDHIRLTPGVLVIGKHTIQCIDILGNNFPQCENHKICSASSQCACAWGFTGEDCSDTCGNGSWGLSCQQLSPLHDTTCIVGSGANNMNTSVAMPFLLVSIILFCLNTCT